MPYLALNGVDVPVLHGSPEEEEISIADRARALDGSVLEVYNGVKRRWRFRTIPLVASDAEAWRGLIRGDGDHITFASDTWSDKGVGPTQTGGHSLGGGGAGTIAMSGYDASLSWAVGAASDWTIVCRAYRPAPGWRTFIKRSDGAQWIDGVRDDAGALRIISFASGALRMESSAFGGADWAALTAKALGARTKVPAVFSSFQVTTAGTSGAGAPAWSGTYGATVTDGTVVWTNVGEDNAYAHDIAHFPFKVPDSWAASLTTNYTANYWSTCPRLRGTGDLFGSGVTVTVEGRVLETGATPMMSSGWKSTAQSFAFELLEV
jgi:hypothetical protein